METTPKGNPSDLLETTLDEENQKLLLLAREIYDIDFCETLSGGYSGARLFLANVSEKNRNNSKLSIIKFDQYRSYRDEYEKHNEMLKNFSSNFKKNHVVKFLYPALIAPNKDRIIIFYEIAGQSLTEFRPLRVFNKPIIISSVVEQIASDLLQEWQGKQSYDVANNNHEILIKLFTSRASIEKNNIEKFLVDDLHKSKEEGILIDGSLFPCPYKFLVDDNLITGRRLFLPTNPQHGDLHSGNILIQRQIVELNTPPYYLIDFLHFKSDGCCLFDLLTLELTLIFDYINQTKIPISSLISDVICTSNLDISKVNFSNAYGISPVLLALHNKILSFIKDNCANHYDDWLASYHLAGVALGLIFTNIEQLSLDLRTISYIYSASHLKQFNYLFDISGPKKGTQIVTQFENVSRSSLVNTTMYDFDYFFQECNSFSPDNLYCGIFNIPPIDNLNVLSRIPWSAVIDFDPYTEKNKHLLHSVKEQLNNSRFVHLVEPKNEKQFNYNIDKSCYWFAARGLQDESTQNEIDLSWKSWNRSFSKPLEQFLERLSNSSLKPMTFVLFWFDDEIIEDIIKIILRYFEETVNILIVFPVQKSNNYLVNRFNLKEFKINIDDFINGLRIKIPARRNQDEEIILPTFDGLSKSIKYQNVPRDKFNWIEEEFEVVHFYLASKQNDVSDYGSSFLRGRRINWFEVNLHMDIDRSVTNDLLKILEDKLAKRDRTTIQLIHNPGAGGTTVASRVAWDLHWTYPVLVLKKFSITSIERLTDVYSRTQQPVLVIIDSSNVSFTNNQISSLFDKILAHRIPAVLLIVTRDFDLPRKSETVIPLSQNLNSKEAYDFTTILSKEAPSRKKQLEDLKINENKANQRIPFVFGLTAFEENFMGIKDFVDERLRNINERERTIIVMISLISYFCNQSVPSQIFSIFVGLSKSKKIDLREYLQKSRQELLIFDEYGWRPLHFLVAKEVLLQLLGDNDNPDSWMEMLTDYGTQIIDLLSELTNESKNSGNIVIATLLRSLFIDRQDAEPEIQTLNQKEPSFSHFIATIPSLEGKRLVFDKLVNKFPDEAHFWGHRARLIWAYAKNIADYEEAVKSINNALSISVEEDPTLYHIKGLALAKWSTFLMDNVKKSNSEKNYLDSEKLVEIEQLVQDSLSIFSKIRNDMRFIEERAYVSAIELITRYIEFGKNISNSTSYAEFFKSNSGRKFYDYLQEAESILRQAKRIKIGISRDSGFLREREVYLNRLYDNYSLLISGLQELVDKHDSNGPKYRRGLAYAYLAKNDRDWEKVDEFELRRIMDLMEENLISDPKNNSHNIRLWFEAARRIKNIGLTYAIQKITQWVNIANNIDELDAYYYLYSLHAISAIEGSEIGVNQAKRFLEVSKKLSQDRPNRMSSLDWIGKAQGISKLIARGHLGKFQEDTSFFNAQDMSVLAPLIGRVYRIYTGQRGIISAYGLDFHFTPAPRVGPYQFIQGRDDNLPVIFYGSFSYEGLRAYYVKPQQ